MRRRPSRVRVAGVLRSALSKLARPVITPGQGQAIRSGVIHRGGKQPPNPPPAPRVVASPPPWEPDGGRRGD